MVDRSSIHASPEVSLVFNREDLASETTLRLEHSTPAQQQLIRLLQDVQFGRIENLVIKNGQPLFDPPPIVTRIVRFHDGPEPKALPPKTDSCLHTSHVRLLDLLRSIQDATIATLIVDAGLPVRAEISTQLINR